MADTTASEPSSTRQTTIGKTIISKILGLLIDVTLFAIFICAGVALLDVLVQTIVLIVGFFSKPPQQMIDLGLAEWNINRHRDDALLLIRSIVATVLGFFLFKYGIIVRQKLLSKIVETRFTSFVGKRYLLAREGSSLVNLITGVSVLGVSVGVMALVVVISVMEGFEKTLMENMMGVFSHVEVWPGTYGEEAMFGTEEYEKMITAIEQTPGVVGAAPLIQRQTFFQSGTGISREKLGGVLRGIDVEREQHVTRLADNILPGGTGTPQFREVVMGKELARKLLVQPGDEVYAFGGKLVSTARGPTGKISKLKVVGIFHTGMHDIDSNFAYTTLETVQNLYLQPDQVSLVHVAVEDEFAAEEIAAQIHENLPSRKNSGFYQIRSWEDINPEFFGALRIEKIAMFIILTLIVVVAALNIIGTLVMVVTQKTREIGILKSMGATSPMIMRIFLFHGFFIGLVGTGMGVACGLWLCRFVEHDIEKIFQLPAGVYGLDKLPVIIDTPTIAFISIVSLLICTSAGIIPSFIASKKDPVESLRYI